MVNAGLRLFHACRELGAYFAHLLFPHDVSVGEAHPLATLVEEPLSAELGAPAEVITHLESLEDHEDVHSTEHYTGWQNKTLMIID